MKVMNPIQLSLSLAGIAVRSQRLMVDFLTRHHELGGLGDPAGIGQAFLDLTAKMIADPMSIAQTQLELWKEHVSWGSGQGSKCSFRNMPCSDRNTWNAWNDGHF